MILRKAFSAPLTIVPFLVLANLTFLNSIVFSQDLSATVLPITGLKLKLKKSLPSSAGLSALVPKIAPALETDFGTGFCIDPECRFIGTNYHVAAFARPHTIKGDEVIQRYLATGPDDDGATLNDYLSDQPLKYTLSRDLAIFELRHPLPHFHGPSFSLYDLDLDQEVDIYAYPKESLHPLRRLEQFHAAYKGQTTAGFLAFEYDGKTIRGGASGGLVVDRKTHQVVGILSRVGLGKNGKQAALAVPIQSLADFVSKVQPWAAEKIFLTANSQVSPALADIYPKFVWPHDSSLQHRSAEPIEIKALREKAQLLSESTRNFIAEQTFEFGKGDVPNATAEFEIQVVDGFQRFRDLESGQGSRDLPLPNRTAIGTGGEWSELPAMVGKALGLKIHQMPDAVINGRRMKVFLYRAEVEDSVPCNFFKIIRDYGVFERTRIATAPCFGEVWTDQNINIERISEHIELPEHIERYYKWKDHGTVVTYGWLRLVDEAPRLVPLTISTEAEYRKKVYWCRGVFMNYRVFVSKAKIVTGYNVQSLPQ